MSVASTSGINQPQTVSEIASPTGNNIGGRSISLGQTKAMDASKFNAPVSLSEIKQAKTVSEISSSGITGLRGRVALGQTKVVDSSELSAITSFPEKALSERHVTVPHS